jgi:hypothetical protein
LAAGKGEAMNNPKQLLAFMFGLAASSNIPLPTFPGNEGNTPFKNINRMPHQGNRERARRILKADKRLGVVKI